MTNAIDRNRKRSEAEVSQLLARGRVAFERHEWNDAFEALTLADQSTALAADDLSRLAWSAGLTARDDEMLATQERVYHACLAAEADLLAFALNPQAGRGNRPPFSPIGKVACGQ
jgi:hypothetical protein